MGDRRYDSPECETRHDELRRAWFDGWTEGVMWMWGKTRQALRQDRQPESVECSVIRHVSSELRSSGGGVGYSPREEQIWVTGHPIKEEGWPTDSTRAASARYESRNGAELGSTAGQKE